MTPVDRRTSRRVYYRITAFPQLLGEQCRWPDLLFHRGGGTKLLLSHLEKYPPEGGKHWGLSLLFPQVL
jgi:hypothetical protein